MPIPIVAVEVQRKWQESDDPDAAGLCTEFYESPELAEGLRQEKQLDARREAEEAKERATSEATAELIEAESDVCSTVREELGPCGLLRVKAVMAYTGCTRPGA